MRPWIIAVLGVAGALIVAFGLTQIDALWIWSEPLSTWFGGQLASSNILQYLSQLAPVTFAIYAAVVLLLTTVTLSIKILRVRSRLERITSPKGSLYINAFAEFDLSRLAARLLKVAPDGYEPFGDMIIIERAFDIADARREIARLYWDWLIRAQFFTALSLFLAAQTIGLAQKYGLIASIWFTVPMPLIVIGPLALALLCCWGRLAVYGASERLLYTIADLPLEQLRAFDRSQYTLLKEFQHLVELLIKKIKVFPAMTRVSAPRDTGLVNLPVLKDLQVSIELLTAKIEGSSAMALASASVNDDRLSVFEELRTAIERLTTQMGEFPAMVRASATVVSGLPPSEPSEIAAGFSRDDNAADELRRLLDDLG